MLNRSSGDRHRIADNVIIIGSAVWMGKEGFWVYPLLTGAAYILESQIKGGYFRSLYLAGISLAGLAIAEFSKEATVLTMEMILVNCLAIILSGDVRCCVQCDAAHAGERGDMPGGSCYYIKRYVPRYDMGNDRRDFCACSFDRRNLPDRKKDH